MWGFSYQIIFLNVLSLNLSSNFLSPVCFHIHGLLGKGYYSFTVHLIEVYSFPSLQSVTSLVHLCPLSLVL